MEETMYLLMAKALNGEITDDEQKALDAWLQADEEHARTYHELQGLWQDTDQVLQHQEFNTAAAWEKVAAQTIGKTAAPEPGANRQISFRKWLQAGSAIAAILLIGIFVYNLSDSREISVTAGSEFVMVDLPDHSRVRLQAYSSLQYQRDFSGKQRKVNLQGEAFFDVQKDASKPFIVEAPQSSVQVLGTSFYVTARPGLTAVAVTTGKVSLKPRQGGKDVMLSPGQKGTYDGSSVQVLADTNFTYYQTGVLHFRQTALEQVVARLALVHSTDIRLAAGITENIKKQTVEISFTGQELEQMLQELCMITNTRWEKTGAQYSIYSK